MKLSLQKQPILTILFFYSYNKNYLLSHPETNQTTPYLVLHRIIIVVIIFVLSTEQLKQICKQYHDRICNLENVKYDLEYVVKRKDVEVHTNTTTTTTTIHTNTTCQFTNKPRMKIVLKSQSIFFSSTAICQTQNKTKLLKKN